MKNHLRLIVVAFLLPGSMILADPDETESEFIRQQADSPIHWQPWGPEMIQQAVDEQKPVYLFVGSFLNEMARLTIRDSFTDAEMIDDLNENFVCVLVDREERPDVDAAAQHYLRSVKQTHGHPTHIWLTPELLPFEGAGYLPPSEDWGQPGLANVVDLVIKTWTTNPDMAHARGKEAQSLMALPTPEVYPAYTDTELAGKLNRALADWRAERGDPVDQFGPAPRKPEPELYRALLQGSPADRAFALGSLEALSRSGLRDPLDGGFFRYATNADGRIPYLQKTLIDQARLALAYLDASSAPDDSFARTAKGIIDYTLSTLYNPGGDFAAAEDATGGDNADFYTWTAAELTELLGSDASDFMTVYGIDPDGNVASEDDMPGRFTGRNILSPVARPEDASGIEIPASVWEALITTRADRTPPPRNGRATAGAHGLILAAMSRAGVELENPEFLSAAAQTYQTIQERLVSAPNNSVRRTVDSATPGGPADYVGLALGCRAYARATGNQGAADLADQLLARSLTEFFESAYSRYLAAPVPLPVGLFARPPAEADPFTPEALALMAGAPDEVATLMRQRLVATWDDQILVPGDILLALTP